MSIITNSLVVRGGHNDCMPHDEFNFGGNGTNAPILTYTTDIPVASLNVYSSDNTTPAVVAVSGNNGSDLHAPAVGTALFAVTGYSRIRVDGPLVVTSNASDVYNAFADGTFFVGSEIPGFPGYNQAIALDTAIPILKAPSSTSELILDGNFELASRCQIVDSADCSFINNGKRV